PLLAFQAVGHTLMGGEHLPLKGGWGCKRTIQTSCFFDPVGEGGSQLGGNWSLNFGTLSAARGDSCWLPSPSIVLVNVEISRAHLGGTVFGAFVSARSCIPRSCASSYMYGVKG